MEIVFFAVKMKPMVLMPLIQILPRSCYTEVLHKYVNRPVTQKLCAGIKIRKRSPQKEIKIKADKYSIKCDYQFILNDTSRNKENKERLI